MNTQELAQNQLAMATVLKETAKARAKTVKPIDAAALVMSGLRSHGFRVVPFPPLKSRKVKTKTNGKTNGHKLKAKRGPGRPRKLAA